MTNYTVRIQETAGSQITPVCVTSASVDDAIRDAAEHLACHGTIHSVEVYPGHDGWYAADECVWRGSLEWSQANDADCRAIQAA